MKYVIIERHVVEADSARDAYTRHANGGSELRKIKVFPVEKPVQIKIGCPLGCNEKDPHYHQIINGADYIYPK